MGITDRFYEWLAWHLPHALVSWCYVRVVAYASTTRFRSTVLGDIGVLDAMAVWYDKLERREPFPEIRRVKSE